MTSPPVARTRAHTTEASWCPFCRAPRHGVSLLKHCWARHRALPLIIVATALGDAERGAEALRAAGFEVNLPALHDTCAKQAPQPRNRRMKA